MAYPSLHPFGIVHWVPVLSSSECLKKSFETHPSVAVLYRNEVSVSIQFNSDIPYTLHLQRLDPVKFVLAVPSVLAGRLKYVYVFFKMMYETERDKK